MPARCGWFGRWLAPLLIAVVQSARLTGAATIDALPRLSLQPATLIYEAWPYVTLMSEKQQPLALADLRAAATEFTAWRNG